MSSQYQEQIRSSIESMRHYFLEKIISLPSIPLPKELIFKYNSMVKSIVTTLAHQSSSNVQQEFHRLMTEHRTNDNPMENHPVQDPKSWNLINEVDLLVPPINEHQFTVSNAQIRNVLLIGQSGSGKSTLVELMLNPHHIVRAEINYANTKIPCPHSVLVWDKDIPIIVNFLDTPGLGDFREEGKGSKEIIDQADVAILNSIESCLLQSMTEIHMVMFVHRLNKKWSEGSKIIAERYEEFLGKGIKRVSWFVLTQCENLLPVELEESKEKYRKAIPLVQRLEGRIGFSGALDQDEIKDLDEDTLKILKEDLNVLRSSLIHNIYNALQPEPLPPAIMNLKICNVQDATNKLQERKKMDDEKKKTGRRKNRKRSQASIIPFQWSSALSCRFQK